MGFYLMRATEDGRLTTPIAGPFDTPDEAKQKGKDKLMGLRKPGRVVLVKVVEEVHVKVTVDYTKYSEGTRRKLGA
jgi:hypothetical protein